MEESQAVATPAVQALPKRIGLVDAARDFPQAWADIQRQIEAAQRKYSSTLCVIAAYISSTTLYVESLIDLVELDAASSVEASRVWLLAPLR